MERWSTATPRICARFSASSPRTASPSTRRTTTGASRAPKTPRSASTSCRTSATPSGRRRWRPKKQSYRDDLGEVEPIAGVEALLDFAEARRLALRRRHQRAARQCRGGARRARSRRPAAAVGARAGAAARQAGSAALSDRAGASSAPMPARSLAFEDSLSGLSAARGAGLDGRRADDDAGGG